MRMALGSKMDRYTTSYATRTLRFGCAPLKQSEMT